MIAREMLCMEKDSLKKGGESSNTPPATSQEDNKILETGGEDTVILSLGVNWGSSFEALQEQLMQARQSAEEKHEMVALELANRLFAVHPGGAGSGGKKGIYFAFRSETGGYRINFTKQAYPKGETPNVIIGVGSTILMTLGKFNAAWDEIQELITSLGGEIIFDKVSRVDLCIDMPDFDVAEFVNCIINQQFICRARKQAFYRDGGKWTGVKIGTGDISIRAYDKAYEVQVCTKDGKKQELLEKRRWGGHQCMAMRVEFQLRRQALKTFGIDSVQDYYEKLSSLIKYQTEEWFRLTDLPVDKENNHQSRAKTLPLWNEISKLFTDWAGKAEESAQRIHAINNIKVEMLSKQAIGCLMSAVSIENEEDCEGEIMEPEEFYFNASVILNRCMEGMGETFYDKLGNKMLAVAAKG